MTDHRSLAGFATALLPLLQLTPDRGAVIQSAATLTADTRESFLAVSSTPLTKLFSVYRKGERTFLEFTGTVHGYASSIEPALDRMAEFGALTYTKKKGRTSAAVYIPRKHEDSVAFRGWHSAKLDSEAQPATELHISLDAIHLPRFCDEMRLAVLAHEADEIQALEQQFSQYAQQQNEGALAAALKVIERDIDAALGTWLKALPENEGLPVTMGTLAALRAVMQHGVLDENLKLTVPRETLAKFGATEAFAAQAASLEAILKQFGEPLLAHAASLGVDATPVLHMLDHTLKGTGNYVGKDLGTSTRLFIREIEAATEERARG